MKRSAKTPTEIRQGRESRARRVQKVIADPARRQEARDRAIAGNPQEGKAKKRFRGKPSRNRHVVRVRSRVIDIGGAPTVIHREMHAAALLHVSVMKLIRWVETGVLPAASAIDADGCRWYSEVWVEFVGAALDRGRRFGLSSEMLAALVAEERAFRKKE